MGNFFITSVESSRADSRVTWFKSTDVSVNAIVTIIRGLIMVPELVSVTFYVFETPDVAVRPRKFYCILSP
jgi:ribosomal protein S19